MEDKQKSINDQLKNIDPEAGPGSDMPEEAKNGGKDE